MATKKHKSIIIPQYELDSLARCFFSEIQKFYESEEGQREFEEWKAKQAAKKALQTEKKAD